MKHFTIPFVSRERDERVLSWLDRRSRGESARDIAKSDGVGPGQVIVATNNVMDADFEESGEPARIVKRGYW